MPLLKASHWRRKGVGGPSNHAPLRSSPKRLGEAISFCGWLYPECHFAPVWPYSLVKTEKWASELVFGVEFWTCLWVGYILIFFNSCFLFVLMFVHCFGKFTGLENIQRCSTSNHPHPHLTKTLWRVLWSGLESGWSHLDGGLSIFPHLCFYSTCQSWNTFVLPFSYMTFFLPCILILLFYPAEF